MAEEVFENMSFMSPPTKELTPSEMTPLVNDVFQQASVRERVLSAQSLSGWEKIGSDDEVDSEVRGTIIEYCELSLHVATY